MDLRPCNLVCLGIDRDVATLPYWATMGLLQLMLSESLVVSLEDVRYFLYIFRVLRRARITLPHGSSYGIQE